MRNLYILLACVGLMALLASCSTQKKYGCPSAVSSDDAVEEVNPNI